MWRGFSRSLTQSCLPNASPSKVLDDITGGAPILRLAEPSTLFCWNRLALFNDSKHLSLTRYIETFTHLRTYFDNQEFDSYQFSRKKNAVST